MSFRVLSASLLLVCIVQSVVLTRLAAADSPTETVIIVDGMHCEGCAKNLAKRLAAVGNVTSAKVDVKSGKATIISTKSKPASAKLLWEAVEAANYTPTRLNGPTGTFTKKPNS